MGIFPKLSLTEFPNTYMPKKRVNIMLIAVSNPPTAMENVFILLDSLIKKTSSFFSLTGHTKEETASQCDSGCDAAPQGTPFV